MTPRDSVLVVDGEVHSQEALRRTLEEEFAVRTATTADEALLALEEAAASVVVCDQRMPGTTGVEMLRQVRERWPDTVRIILSGYTDTDDIVSGINDAGIWQYVLKPWQPGSLLLTVRRAAELHRLQREHQRLSVELRPSEPVLRRRVDAVRHQVRRAFDFDRLLRAPGSPIDDVCRIAARVAPYDISVLVAGDSGTGKELLARAIHHASGRTKQPFVVQLRRAARSAARIGALGLPAGRLHRCLPRPVRAVHTGERRHRVPRRGRRDLPGLPAEAAARAPGGRGPAARQQPPGVGRCAGDRSHQPQPRGTRRPVAVPRGPLLPACYGHARPAAVARSARRHPGACARPARASLDRTRKARRQIRAEVLARLRAYPWPGNVRELQNEVHRMVALADGPQIDFDLLAPKVRGVNGAAAIAPGDATMKRHVEALEASLLREALVRHRGNKSRAAEELGLSRVGVRAELSRYGLDREGRGRNVR